MVPFGYGYRFCFVFVFICYSIVVYLVYKCKKWVLCRLRGPENIIFQRVHEIK